MTTACCLASRDFVKMLSSFSPRANREAKLKVMFEVYDIDGDGECWVEASAVVCTAVRSVGTAARALTETHLQWWLLGSVC